MYSQAKNDLTQLSSGDSSKHLVRRDTRQRKKFRKVFRKKNPNEKRSRQRNSKREKQQKNNRNKTFKKKNGRRTKSEGLRKMTGVEVETKFTEKYLLYSWVV